MAAMDDLGEGSQFLRDCNIPKLVNEMMLAVMRDKPEDPVQAIKTFLEGVDHSLYKHNPAANAAPAKAEAAAEAPAEEEEELFDLSGKDDELNKLLDKALAEGKTGLNIAKNQLSKLPAALVNNESVTGLSIEENQIQNYDDLLTMKNLKELNISDNPAFKTFPEGFAEKLASLEKIDAYKCAFTGELSNELTKLPNLTYLNFYNNGLLKLPSEINKVTSLTELNMASNKIMAVQPTAFDGLCNLRRLALFWNRILRIPSIAPLTKLKELQLNGNQLQEMPELGVHEDLESVNLSENKMTTLHASLFNQPNLEEFSAGKNLLTSESLLTGWTNLNALKKIQLPNNQITVFHREWLDMPNLVCLELNENAIEELPEDIDKLQNKAQPIKVLFLAENKITSLPPSMARLENLMRIAFKGCPLDLEKNDTKSTYEAIEASVKAKEHGKFIDQKRGASAPKPRAPAGPSTLGIGGGAMGPAGGGGAVDEQKKKKSNDGMPTTGEVSISIG